MVGDGPMRAPTQALLDSAGLGHLAWLPGERKDIATVDAGMANCIARWSAQPDLAARMGRAGRVEVEERFSLDSMVESYRRLYADRLAACANQG